MSRDSPPVSKSAEVRRKLQEERVAVFGAVQLKLFSRYRFFFFNIFFGMDLLYVGHGHGFHRVFRTLFLFLFFFFIWLVFFFLWGFG